MSYKRVIPRDLFNEASLLKCYGRLAILLDGTPLHWAMLGNGDGSPFEIDQDPSDGSLSITNLPFMIGNKVAQLFRPLNARDQWPLYARLGDDEIEVFDEHGDLSRDFWAAIRP